LTPFTGFASATKANTTINKMTHAKIDVFETLLRRQDTPMFLIRKVHRFNNNNHHHHHHNNNNNTDGCCSGNNSVCPVKVAVRQLD
jgi:hypothetical protein